MYIIWILTQKDIQASSEFMSSGNTRNNIQAFFLSHNAMLGFLKYLNTYHATRLKTDDFNDDC